MTWLEDVKKFHEVMGQPVLTTPTVPSIDRLLLRLRLITEEYVELLEAATGEDGGDAKAELTSAFRPENLSRNHKTDLVAVADALADLIYVINGTALEFGIPLDAVFDEVHRSNLSKLDADGRPVVLPGGKIGKSARYSRPDLAGILKAHGWSGQ